MKPCLAILAIFVLLQSPTGSPHMYSTETSHPGSFDSFVCPPTCAARNLHLSKIYEASTNRVSPVISPEGCFLKIITSIRGSAGRSFLALAFPACPNIQCTHSPQLQQGQPAILLSTVPHLLLSAIAVGDNPHIQELLQASKGWTLVASGVIYLCILYIHFANLQNLYKSRKAK